MKKIFAILLTLSLTLFIFSGCKSEPKENGKTQEKVRVTALMGPTGMGLCKMTENENYDISLISSAEISSIVSQVMQNECDICAVPINFASVLSNKTQGKAKIIGTATLGVLYILENGNSITDINELCGKTIYATGQGSTPEYILRYVLSENGIDPDKDVTLEFIGDHSELATLLSSNIHSVGMLPEPNVTAVLSANKDFRIALDLTKEWEKVSDKKSLIQGVFIARTEFCEKNPELIDKFLDDYKLSSDYVNNNPKEASLLIEKAGIVQKAQIAEKAIPNCNITNGKEETYKDIKKCLEVLYSFNPSSVGGKIPEDTDFFYYSSES